MNYPKTRLRRLRYNKNIRKLFEDININKSDLIQPIFIVEGDNIKKEIKSLKGQYQLSIDNTITFCKELILSSFSVNLSMKALLALLCRASWISS